MTRPLDCSASCVKYLLFLCGFTLFLTGAVILGVSIWVKVDPSIVQYIEVLSVDQNDPLWQTATVLLVAVGAFIFVVGFIGCCGACKESPCLLWLYIAFLVLIFIAEVAAAIFAIVFKRDLLKVLDKTLSKQAKVYVEDKYQKTAPINLAWHAMQVNLECCGGHSYVDFIESPYFNKTNPVPLSCCTLRTKDPLNPVPTNKAECFKSANGQDTKPNVYLHTTNCTGALENWLSSKTVILVSVAFAVAILQLLGIVFACCLRKEILGGEKF